MGKRRGGIIQLQINGEVYRAKGNFTYNLGIPMREAIIGADAVHGFKETPQVGFIEGEITDSSDISLEALLSFSGGTVSMKLANDKMVIIRDAYQAAEGTGNTEEGNVGVRFEGEAQEVAP